MPQDKAWKEDPLGPPDSEGHAKFVSDVTRVVDSYTRQAQQTWTKITGYYNLYFGEWTDPRDPVTEKWRSHVTLPYPFSGSRSQASQPVGHLHFRRSDDPGRRCRRRGLPRLSWSREADRLHHAGYAVLEVPGWSAEGLPHPGHELLQAGLEGRVQHALRDDHGQGQGRLHVGHRLPGEGSPRPRGCDAGLRREAGRVRGVAPDD